MSNVPPSALNSEPPSEATRSGLIRCLGTHQPNLIEIPTTPLVPEGQHLNKRHVRLEIESPICLRLDTIPPRPPWFSRLLYLVLILCLLFMLYYGVQGIFLALERNNATTLKLWSGLAALPALLLLGVLIYPFFHLGPLQFRFDRQTNLLTVKRTVGLKHKTRLMATYNLADAVALQLLHRYYKAFQAGLSLDKVKTPSYELNLIFRHLSPSRINLAVHSDGKWMQQAGPRLAEFLDLPVIDQLCQPAPAVQ
jgi:hypothetical protein